MWVAVLAGALGCYALKLAGLSVPQRLVDSPSVGRVTALLPIGLLAALVVTGTLGDGRGLTIDARLVGLAAAVVALLLRAPFLVVVVVAAAAAAIVRLLA